ncbi:adenylate/guanylate cyclase domain-containing protein [bacterium]|nr:adenylate/guanylate cyclase domain-containing protein [bacterium]
MKTFEEIYEWALSGCLGTASPAKVLQILAENLVEAGFPIDRLVCFIRTLHPNLAGRLFLWYPGKPVEVKEATYAFFQMQAQNNMLALDVLKTGTPIRRRFWAGDSFERMPDYEEQNWEEFTEYLVEPIKFINGDIHLITFATRAERGFTDSQVSNLRKLMQPFARVAEIYALNRTATNLLDTYVGNNAGARILSGKIKRGDTEVINAVIWFSDLRGFTSMSDTLPPMEIIRVLNDLFDCQVPAITGHGGEVLKFIGDGLFAIFPLKGTDKTPSEVCDEALIACYEAFSALDELNKKRQLKQSAEIQFGVAFHIGEVAFGNIGGRNRLDFTCIGSAVNLAARLEGLTGSIGQRMVCSKTFAQTTGKTMKKLGEFELKGVSEAQEVFTTSGQ